MRQLHLDANKIQSYDGIRRMEHLQILMIEQNEEVLHNALFSLQKINGVEGVYIPTDQLSNVLDS